MSKKYLFIKIHLSLSEIQKLAVEGRTSFIEGMKSKSGKSFDAFIVVDQQVKSCFEFVNKDKSSLKSSDY